MGITGTEVAKSAAKIVITDDNFATIVGAVQQGRVVYANLKKVILYLFATSMDEVLVLLLALLGGFPLPLAAVQILWINIVTEGTLTVNLVMDPADGDEMRRAPVPRDDRLLGADAARVALMTPLIVGPPSAGSPGGWAGRAAGPSCAPRPSPCWPCASGSTCSTASRPRLGAGPAHRAQPLAAGRAHAVGAAAGAGAVRAADERAVPHRAAAAGVAAAAAAGLASVVLWVEGTAQAPPASAPWHGSASPIWRWATCSVPASSTCCSSLWSRSCSASSRCTPPRAPRICSRRLSES
jgi:hypothetical protein